MLKLELTDEQAQVLLEILDEYVKKTGLNGAQNALFFQKKVVEAVSVRNNEREKQNNKEDSI